MTERPSTRDAIAAVRAALEAAPTVRDSHYEHFDRPGGAGAGCPACHAAAAQREMERAALAALRDRLPLADDPALDRIVYAVLTYENVTTLGERIRRLLEAIDRRLFGNHHGE